MRMAVFFLLTATVGALAGALYGQVEARMRSEQPTSRTPGRIANALFDAIDKLKPTRRPLFLLWEACLAPVVLVLAAAPFVLTLMAPAFLSRWLSISNVPVVLVGFFLSLASLWLLQRRGRRTSA